MSETERSFLSRGNLLLAAVVTLGIVLPGVAGRLLGEVGYDDLEIVMFTLSYTGMVVIVWYGWIHPLDITGPAEQRVPVHRASPAPTVVFTDPGAAPTARSPQYREVRPPVSNENSGTLIVDSNRPGKQECFPFSS